MIVKCIQIDRAKSQKGLFGIVRDNFKNCCITLEMAYSSSAYLSESICGGESDDVTWTLNDFQALEDWAKISVTVRPQTRFK